MNVADVMLSELPRFAESAADATVELPTKTSPLDIASLPSFRNRLEFFVFARFYGMELSEILYMCAIVPFMTLFVAGFPAMSSGNSLDFGCAATLVTSVPS